MVGFFPLVPSPPQNPLYHSPELSLTQLSHGNGGGCLPIGEGTVGEETWARGEVADGLWLDAIDVQARLVGWGLDVKVEAADARFGLGSVGRVAVHVAAQVIVELGQAIGGEAVGWGEGFSLTGLLLVVPLLLLEPVFLHFRIEAVPLFLWHPAKLHRCRGQNRCNKNRNLSQIVTSSLNIIKCIQKRLVDQPHLILRSGNFVLICMEMYCFLEKK